WKPTYVILKKHEEYLQKELQNYQEATEKDKYAKTYEHFIVHLKHLKMYQDYMNQYQEVFRQHQAKYLETTIAQEYYREKKEYEEIQDRVQQHSKLFKQKEAELIDLHTILKQQSAELVKTAKELEKKMNYLKEKLVQSVPTVKSPFQITERGAENKEDLAGHSTVTSIYFNHMENENQIFLLILLTNQKNTLTKQCFNIENTKGKKSDYKQKENKSMDSAVISQSEISTKPGYYSSTRDADTAAAPGLITLEPNIVPKTPDSGEMRTPFELFPPESEGLLVKSPAFSFLAGFSSKSQSPGFNFFDFSAFETESSLDQLGENCSAGNINPISPHKSIEYYSIQGDFFGKMDTEDSFTLSFPTLPSAQVFQDGKEDFNFPFAFGSSEQSTLKGFQSASENRKPFSLF
ncbi:hypothetical protein E2320_021684, partial [Naja naja]